MRNSYRMESGKMTVLFDNIDFLELVSAEGTIDAYIWYKPKIKIEKKRLINYFNSKSDLLKVLPNTYKILGTYAINMDKILSFEVTKADKRNMLTAEILFSNTTLTIVEQEFTIKQFAIALK